MKITSLHSIIVLFIVLKYNPLPKGMDHVMVLKSNLKILNQHSIVHDTYTILKRNLEYCYAISSFSMYIKSEAIAIAGKTSPTNGTKTEGR